LTKRHIIYLNKDSEVIFPFLLDSENYLEEMMMAAIDSDPRLIQIDGNCPAEYGWKYINDTLIDPDGKPWDKSLYPENSSVIRVIFVVDEDVAAFIKWPTNSPTFEKTLEQIMDNPTKVEADPEQFINIGWKYDGEKFYDPKGVA